MLDKKLLKKGMRVYRVEWVDSLDPYIVIPIPRIREYQITQVGPKFIAVRQVCTGRRAGMLGSEEKANAPFMLRHYQHTAESAMSAALLIARSEQRAATEELARAKQRETLLKQSDGAALVDAWVCLLDHRGATVATFSSKAWRHVNSDTICPLPVRFTTTKGIYVVSAVVKCDGARDVRCNLVGRNLGPGDMLEFDWKDAVIS